MVSLIDPGLSFGYYSLLFVFIFAGSFGIPGATIWMLSSGALAGSISGLALVCGIVFIGAVFGDLGAYEVSRRFSFPITKRLRRLAFYRHNEKKAKSMFDRSAFALVFFTRFFIFELCAVVTYLCGFERLERKRFLGAMLPGELIYAVAYPSIGYMFRETWTDTYSIITNVVVISLLVVVLFFLLRLVKKRWGMAA